MDKTKGSDIDFLNRADGGGETATSASQGSATTTSGQSKTPSGTFQESESSRRQKESSTKIKEMLLIYLSSKGAERTIIRKDFVDSMLRSKSKAQRDAVIATGLLPFGFAADVLLTFVRPFGGLVEIDGVWAYSSFRGVKASRDVSKRLKMDDKPSNENSAVQSSTLQNAVEIREGESLRLIFFPSHHMAMLEVTSWRAVMNVTRPFSLTSMFMAPQKQRSCRR